MTGIGAGNTMTTVPVQEKKGRGCFFYGCLTTIILLILIAIGGYIAFKRVTSYVVAEYTSETPLGMPQLNIGESEYEAVKTKLEAFGTALSAEDGKKPDSLVLSGREINALIIHHPDLKEMKGHISVDIKEDTILGTVSIPLDSVGFPGRFVNGEGALRASFDHGSLWVNLLSLTVNGKSVPDTVMKEMQKENLAKGLDSSPERNELFTKIDRITVSGGLVTVSAKS